MNYPYLRIALLLSLSAATLPAQTTSQPDALPPGPLIAKNAPDFSQWVATTVFKNATDASGDSSTPSTPASKPPPPQIIKVVKTGTVRHVTFITGTETTGETWCKGTFELATSPAWSEPILSTGANKYDAVRLDFSHGDFAGFGWISASNFSGMRKVGGHSCMVFASSLADNPNSPAIKVPSEAVIDLQTRLPVSLQVGKSTTTYVFGEAPTEVLTLPPKLAATLDSWNRKIQALAGTPTRP